MFASAQAASRAPRFLGFIILLSFCAALGSAAAAEEGAAARPVGNKTLAKGFLKDDVAKIPGGIGFPDQEPGGPPFYEEFDDGCVLFMINQFISHFFCPPSPHHSTDSAHELYCSPGTVHIPPSLPPSLPLQLRFLHVLRRSVRRWHRLLGLRSRTVHIELSTTVLYVLYAGHVPGFLWAILLLYLVR